MKAAGLGVGDLRQCCLDRLAEWLAADDEPDADGDAMRAELEGDLVTATDPVKPFMHMRGWQASERRRQRAQ